MQVPKFSTLPYQRPDYEAAKAELDALTEQAKERRRLRGAKGRDPAEK